MGITLALCERDTFRIDPFCASYFHVIDQCLSVVIVVRKVIGVLKVDFLKIVSAAVLSDFFCSIARVYQAKGLLGSDSTNARMRLSFLLISRWGRRYLSILVSWPIRNWHLVFHLSASRECHCHLA